MYVLEQTGSASIFASLLALAMLPTILLSPFGGILADRANRRNVMVALDTFSGLSVLIATVILPFGYDIFVIGALLVILSVLGAFESPTVQALSLIHISLRRKVCEGLCPEAELYSIARFKIHRFRSIGRKGLYPG